MNRSLERRLARARAPIDRQERQERQAQEAARGQRVRWRANVEAGQFIRECFADWGIDPAGAPALKLADEAADKLAALPDDEELRRADQKALGWSDLMAENYWWCTGDIVRLARRYARDPAVQPDFARASFAELLAWCLSRLRPDVFAEKATADC